jgi:hypothetical protein
VERALGKDGVALIEINKLIETSLLAHELLNSFSWNKKASHKCKELKE